MTNQKTPDEICSEYSDKGIKLTCRYLYDSGDVLIEGDEEALVFLSKLIQAQATDQNSCHDSLSPCSAGRALFSAESDTGLYIHRLPCNEGVVREGLDRILDKYLDMYSDIINSIETQSCHHGPDGSVRKGEDWQMCCGISYEYWNDITIRDKIDSVVKNANPSSSQSATLQEIDNRLKRLLEQNEVASDGVDFWRRGLPYGVKP